MLILLVICSIIVSTYCSLYDGGNYYEFGDEKKADCILAQDMGTYTYLGNRDHTIRGEHCLEWKTVYDSIIKSLDEKPDELQEYQTKTAVAEEFMPHNKCRRLSLPANHPMKHLMKSTNIGPWCYVQRNKNIAIEKCFLPCRGEPREEKASPDKTQYGAKEVLKNYNDLLIENIRKYYKSYHWGESSYYRWKPSDSAFSAEYFRIREQVIAFFKL
ncbi:unnamed protein product [Cylicocyclus nassatus]|uniref:Kringle domain-containing protein n=1 Tax=Cylicocyclus nassatus TaxID=53992 RepID=A0AA36GFD7_CYLNA|nr:unnamed protein product [Cylicocyclus nassatus]